ncbi:unnamed protein product [Enterobius vermicularis]|uniref:HEAT repeat protein n=1 Tax=Enterobius vermicularis TaxID=51028 RepID=A0A0N4VHW8_ENTVE|nr:unnamed protein product [Enterobius vermicularis]
MRYGVMKQKKKTQPTQDSSVTHFNVSSSVLEWKVAVMVMVIMVVLVYRGQQENFVLVVRKELAPCAQMLAKDSNPNVRSSVAQRLGVIAQSLNNANDCATLLLPCLIELCKDDDLGVREAILNTIAVCLPHFSKGIYILEFISICHSANIP